MCLYPRHVLFQVYDSPVSMALGICFQFFTFYFIPDYLIFQRHHLFVYIYKSFSDFFAADRRCLSFSKNHFRSYIYHNILPGILESKRVLILYLYFENHLNERSLSFVFHRLGIKVVGLLPYYFSLYTSSSIVPTIDDIKLFYSPALFYTLGDHSMTRLSRIFPTCATIQSFIVGRSITLTDLKSLSLQHVTKLRFLILLPYHIDLSKRLLHLVGSLSKHLDFTAIVKLHPTHKMSYFDDLCFSNISFICDISLFRVLNCYSFSHCLSLITSAALELLPIPIHILLFT